MKVNIDQISAGDIFSEVSHFTVKAYNGTTKKFIMHHQESGQEVSLTKEYVHQLLNPADQYEREEEVGKEDKFWTAKQVAEEHAKGNTAVRENDLKQKGIRTIWNEIRDGRVFTVNFNKAVKKMSEKEKNAKIDAALKSIEDAKYKKGATGVAAQVLEQFAQDYMNQKGEERTLKGYKTQFSSVTGQYDVVDMEIAAGQPNSRQVNVNTINWLVVDGTKYIVK